MVIFLFRFLYHTLSEGPSGYALYFNGSTGLRLSTPMWQTLANNMRVAFTLEIWIQIEGGQPDSVTIIGVFFIRFHELFSDFKLS